MEDGHSPDKSRVQKVHTPTRDKVAQPKHTDIN